MSSARERSPLDLGLVWVLLRRALKTRSFILLLALGGSITGAIVFVIPPVFRSEATLRFREQAVGEPGAAPQSDSATPLRLEMELNEILVSHAVPEALIKEFGLYPKTMSRFGLEAAAEEMKRQNLHLTVLEDGVIRLSFDSPSPELAQSVVSRAVALLVQANATVRSAQVKEMEQFLDSEKRRVGQERRLHESKIASFWDGNPGMAEGDSLPRTTPSGAPAMASPLRDQFEELKRKERESREYLAILENREFRGQLQSLSMTRIKSADLVELSPATKPGKPEGLSRALTIAMGLCAALAVALVIGLLVASNDDRLRNAADIRRFGLPQVLCEVPPLE